VTPTIVGIYREANAAIVERLLEPAVAVGWPSAWWALDRVAKPLAAVTVGEGPGEKLPLLNRVLERRGPVEGPLLLSDDDIAFERGDVVELVSLSERAGLSLAQPAHAEGSEVSHGITRARPRSRVRLTTFVESGPLVVVAADLVPCVAPLPEARGMGWGLELDWIDLGVPLGIVDAVRVRHLGKVSGTYDDSALRKRMGAELAARGVADWAPLQRTVAVWRPWQRRPPWGIT
jgi:hypothetical protein